MNEPTKNCPKCSGVMNTGFILDSGHGNSKMTPVWIEGNPEESFWAGGLKTKDKKQFDIQDFRCSICGFIESYATQERTDKKK